MKRTAMISVEYMMVIQYTVVTGDAETVIHVHNLRNICSSLEQEPQSYRWMVRCIGERHCCSMCHDVGYGADRHLRESLLTRLHDEESAMNIILWKYRLLLTGC
jgi:hypothetical protein